MRVRKTLTLFVAVLMMAGCSSVTPMYPEPEIVKAAINPGDKVFIQTKDDDGQWYTVDKVNETSIICGTKEILYADIKRMEKLEDPDITNDESKMLGIVALNLFGIYLIFHAIFGI